MQKTKDSLGVWRDSHQPMVRSHCSTLSGGSLNPILFWRKVTAFYHHEHRKRVWEFLSRRSGLQHRRKDRTRFNLAQISLLGFFQGKGPKRRITKVRLGEHTVGGQCWSLLVRNLKIISLTENNFRLPQQSKGRFTSRAGIQYYSGCSFCAWAVQVIYT